MRLYVVRWLHDYFYYETAFKGGVPDCPASHRLVKAFLDPVAADDYRQRLERGLATPPAGANPFHGLREEFGVEGRRITCIEDLTSFPEPIFDNWIRDCGLEPPQPVAPQQRRDWPAWWDAQVAQMSQAQIARMWQALDQVRFFEIVETNLEI
jgi:hypothetical protein